MKMLIYFENIENIDNIEHIELEVRPTREGKRDPEEKY